MEYYAGRKRRSLPFSRLEANSRKLFFTSEFLFKGCHLMRESRKKELVVFPGKVGFIHENSKVSLSLLYAYTRQFAIIRICL